MLLAEPIESALPWIANLMHTSRMWQVGQQRRLCSDEHPLCRDSRHKTGRLGSDEVRASNSGYGQLGRT